MKGNGHTSDPMVLLALVTTGGDVVSSLEKMSVPRSTTLGPLTDSKGWLRSSTVKESLNPTWDESLSICIPPLPQAQVEADRVLQLYCWVYRPNPSDIYYPSAIY